MLPALRPLAPQNTKAEQARAQQQERGRLGNATDLIDSSRTVTSPGGVPELGATINVGDEILKNVEPKLPVNALEVPGPSCNGLQVMLTWLTLDQTEPPVEVPTNSPVAVSVVSVTTKSKVKAPNDVPKPDACVPQVGHERRKSPKLTLDGTPDVLTGLGLNVRVAAAPPVLLSTSVPPTNIVSAELVLNVTVEALALATIRKSATAVIPAAWTNRLIVIVCISPHPSNPRSAENRAPRNVAGIRYISQANRPGEKPSPC